MPRALWSGAITFGLVNIPVKLYRATSPRAAKGVGFHQLHATCGTRLKHLRWCPKDEVEVPWEEVAKGYEVSKGRYVIVDEEELEGLLPPDDYAAVAIEHFVGLDEVDPLFYDQGYYLSPEGNPKAYVLLRHAMESSGRVAIARVRLRTREHLAVVRPHDGHLVLETMYFPAELIDPAEVPALPSGREPVDARQAQAAQQLIDSMTVPFDPSRYHDEYTERVGRLIEQKLTEGAVTEVAQPVAEAGGQVVDLLDALKKSLASAQAGKPEPAEGAAEKKARRPKEERARAHARRKPSGTRKKAG